MGSGDGRAAILMVAANILDFQAAGAVIVHGLSQTAGMRQRRGDRQGYGSEGAHEQQNKQQSGGKAVHGWLGVRQTSQSKG
jgi:hypothetical protein